MAAIADNSSAAAAARKSRLSENSPKNRAKTNQQRRGPRPGTRSLALPGRTPRTSCAQPVHGYFVVARFEAARQTELHGARAALELVDRVALLADEVMVVALAGDFVQRWTPGKLDRLEPPFVDERPDGAVHGCNTKAVAVAARRLADLLGGKRTLRGFENATNRAFLPGVT